MRMFRLMGLITVLGCTAMAQSWEAGVTVGGGFYSTSDLTSSAGTAAATWSKKRG